ncbi:outer membrane protein [Paragemmobacter ruber]|uniref:Porin n=1 Tax=Paragemmobacter ruber TaxID=1985673 RepID=A0ABW9Y7N6_9RHOB|nr:porin [Rhodobacter ruber]NBE08515.1 porin [Rhodobacter ruber]
MKLMTAKVAAAALAVFGAAPALAGGPTEAYVEPTVAPAPAPVAAPSADWSGFYAGGQLGYGDVGGVVEGSGFTSGLIAGYRADFGQFVAGVEANYDWTDIDLAGGAATLDNVARLKLIGGYDLGPALVYGTVAAARAESSLGSDDGYAYGVGMDYAVTDRVTVGAELLEHKFDNYLGVGDVDATTFNTRVGFRF